MRNDWNSIKSIQNNDGFGILSATKFPKLDVFLTSFKIQVKQKKKLKKLIITIQHIFSLHRHLTSILPQNFKSLIFSNDFSSEAVRNFAEIS